LTLSYALGSWEWVGPILSNFTGKTGQVEGACGYDPSTDTYILKSAIYTKSHLYRVYDKTTSTQINTFPSPYSGVCIDFDSEGNYYIAAWCETLFAKFAPDHQLIWTREKTAADTGKKPSGIAYRHQDKLLYACYNKSTCFLVLDPQTGKLVKSLPIKGRTPRGQWHPIKCLPLEIDGNVEEVILIENDFEDKDSPEKGGFCYAIREDCVLFIKIFHIPLANYLNYIYDSSCQKLLVSECQSSRWLEYQFQVCG